MLLPLYSCHQRICHTSYKPPLHNNHSINNHTIFTCGNANKLILKLQIKIQEKDIPGKGYSYRLCDPVFSLSQSFSLPSHALQHLPSNVLLIDGPSEERGGKGRRKERRGEGEDEMKEEGKMSGTERWVVRKEEKWGKGCKKTWTHACNFVSEKKKYRVVT